MNIISSFSAPRSLQTAAKSFVCKGFFRRSVALFGLAAALLIAAPANKVSAQGFFDLFGLSRQAPSNQTLGYAGTGTDGSQTTHSSTPARSPSSSTSYCVRTCDGRFFPIQSNGNASPAQLCNALCPAAETKVFSGSEIGRSVAKDGTRYASLQNAFAYRTRIVSGCTCNGKDSFGTATIDASADPTLRKGDIVATADTQLPTTTSNKR
jgi:hypothetical protein